MLMIFILELNLLISKKRKLSSFLITFNKDVKK